MLLLLACLLGQISLRLNTGKIRRYIICSDSFTPSGYGSAQMGHLMAGGGGVRVGGGASGQIDSIYTSASMAAWRDAVVIVLLAGATFPAA